MFGTKNKIKTAFALIIQLLIQCNEQSFLTLTLLLNQGWEAGGEVGGNKYQGKIITTFSKHHTPNGTVAYL